MVGVWDLSQQFQTSSQHNPNRRCSIKLLKKEATCSLSINTEQNIVAMMCLFVHLRSCCQYQFELSRRDKQCLHTLQDELFHLPSHAASFSWVWERPS